MPMLLALDTNDPVVLSLTILLAGLVVVFLVLIVLIWIVKGYGTLIYKSTHKDETEQAPAAPSVPAPAAPVYAAPAPVAEEGIPGEVIAAIAAAVYCTEGVPASAIRSVRRSRSASRSAWATAGILENTRPF